MPPDRVTYGTFLELADKAETDLRAVIEGVAADRDHQRGTARQIADLYASLMNQARAEELGLQPIAALLQRIDAVDTPRDLASEAGYLSAIALGGPFLGAVEEDLERPGTPIATIAQGGTLLPDRDYYVKDDERFIRIRALYVDYLASIFSLAQPTERRSRRARRARAGNGHRPSPLDRGANPRSVEHREEVLARGARA